MKVLEFIRKFNDSTQTFIYNEMTGLLDHGLDLHVLCTKRLYPEKFPMPKLTHCPLSVVQRFLSNRLAQLGIRMAYRNTPLRHAIHQVMTSFQPAIVHCHFGTDGLYFIDNYQGGDRPIFVHFHGFDASLMLKKALYRARLNELFQRPDVFPIFVSNFMRDNVARSGVNIPRHYILYYGTDTDFFQRQNPAPEKAPLTFLQVSSIREKKGHEYSLRALALFQQQHPGIDWRYLITGDGAMRKGLEELTQELGIQDRVEFVGFVSPAEARELMEQAHVFLHHSVTGQVDGDMEGIPNAIMEAMAMELPVVSTLHSGIPELVEDGVNGYLVTERDVITYAERLFQISSWELQPKNREKVMSAFEKRQHARQLAGFYQDALQQMRN